jgi:hypothetical protein
MGELRLDVNKIGSSGARHADVASFAGPEHHRNGLVRRSEVMAHQRKIFESNVELADIPAHR